MIFIKKLFLSLSLLLSFTLFGCQQSNGIVEPEKEMKEQDEVSNTSIGEKDVREKVWEQLKENDKERINGTWKDGKVSKVTLNKDMLSQVKDKSYEGKEVYLISFPTDEKSEPNIMTVYADVNTYNFIGYALVQ